MTDNEIIKALECCIKDNCDCGECPAIPVCQHDADCPKTIALALINRQKAEIESLNKKYQLAVTEREANVKGFTEEVERLEGNLKFVRGTVERLRKANEILSANADTAFQEGLNEAQELYAQQIKNETRDKAIKEFAERVKENVTYHEDECGDFVAWVDCRNIDRIAEKIIEKKGM